MNCNSFFFPEIIQSPAESPFFKSYTALYGNYRNSGADDSPSVQEVNTSEWAKYYEGALPNAQLWFLLYGMGWNDVRDLAASLEGKNVPLTSEVQAIKVALVKYG